MELPQIPVRGNGLNVYFIKAGLVVLSGIILVYGKPLLLPLSFAMFVSFVLYPVCRYLESKGFSRAIAITTGLLMISALLGLLIWILYLQFMDFVSDWSLIRTKLVDLISSANRYAVKDLGFSEQSVAGWADDLTRRMGSEAFSVLQNGIVVFMVNMVLIILIPIYSFLILYHRTMLVDVFLSFFEEAKRIRVREIVALSVNTYYNFIKGMLVVYAVVGILNSLGLLLLGVPHAVLFGFLTAIMTFIPYVGIIVASLLPISYAWLEFNSVWYPLGVIGVFSLVQYLEANVIFPIAVSQRLKINTLATLIAIVVGGIVWGAAGMILFVPFTAILKLFADRMNGWEQVARFLGQS